ncbi:MAG: hypothetical protein QHH14_14625, partial [Clostridiales bacterium]|nr:hypothetical protein [Clostridiales bacterium]
MSSNISRYLGRSGRTVVRTYSRYDWHEKRASQFRQTHVANTPVPTSFCFSLSTGGKNRNLVFLVRRLNEQPSTYFTSRDRR